MSLASRPSPARVTQAGAAKLPRAALLVLLAAYLLIGLSPHSPWPDEGLDFGAIWTVAHGAAADWWFPTVAGARYAAQGPLPVWVGALVVRAVGAWIGDTAAARLATAAWFTLASAALWYATLRFARRDEAQPVALAFGGHADARDYGRMLADVSLLLLIGTIGIGLRMHEATTDAALVAFGAIALHGVALALDRLFRGAALCGLAVAGFALSSGPLPAIGLLLGVGAALVCAARAGNAGHDYVPFDPQPRGHRPGAIIGALALTLAIATVVTAAWPLAALQVDPQRAAAFFGPGPAAWGPAAGLAREQDASWFFRSAAWYLWPLWPLALWALYAWRAVRPAAHVVAPLLVVLGLVGGGACCAPVGEPALAPLVAPLAALAAFGGTTLRRAADNLMDWLAIVLFSLAMLFLWAYFFAMATGVPVRMAASIAHLAPGWREVAGPGPVAAALAAAALWFLLAARRVVRPSRALWRGPLLAAVGVTATWTVIVALFLPAFDYTQSHRDIALEIARQVPWPRGTEAEGACLQAHRVPVPLRALIAYDAGLRFGRGDDGEACRFALQRISSPLDEDPPPGHPGSWRRIWDGHRAARPQETWRVWERAE